MPINPVQFAHAICDEFLRYIFSAFPLADPDLAEQARKLLQRPSSLNMPLVRGPYISLSESFAKGDLITNLQKKGMLHPAMPDLIGYETMWSHQQQVFENVRKGRHVLVSTGTGSGKTESFLFPIIDDLLRQRDAGVHDGLAAILVYPMNALANDQLDRLRDFLGGTGISFGQWIGTTPDKEKDVTVERFEGSSRAAYLAERKKRKEQALVEERALRPLAPKEECCSEENLRTRKPRILITNYRQLEVLATRLPDVLLFAHAPLKYLVFDEAHTYDGAAGAEVSCLIRRLRVLAGKKPDEIVCIGTSATLTDPNAASEENAALRFASRFFGVSEKSVALIGESYVAREWPTRRYKPTAPRGAEADAHARLSRIIQAVTEPVDVAGVKIVVEELTGQIFEPGNDWRAALFEHLVTNEYIFQSTQILKQPKHLDAAAWGTSQRVATNRIKQGAEANVEMLAYLVLGAAARKDGESLLRPKVHFFIRGLDEMVVGFDSAAQGVKANLFMSISDAKENNPAWRDDAFFSVLTCRTCGQHFFEKYYKDLQYTRGRSSQITGFLQGDATSDDKGKDNAVWSTAPEEGGMRLRATTHLLEEVDNPGSTKSQRWPRGYFCRCCGALHRNPGEKCMADGCGHAQPLLPLIVFGDELKSCPSCGTLAIRIGGRTIEPTKKIRAVTVADIHILAQAMINAAPDGHKKLIVFADSRQDAAFQAGWMQDHARRIRLRHMIHQAIHESAAPLPLYGIVDALMAEFKKNKRLVEVLLPELTEEHAGATLGSDRAKNIYTALRYMVLREFTNGIRRTDCLESMGLARVVYDGLTPQRQGVKDFAAALGVRSEDACEGLALLLDNWRRSRILFVRDDPIFSQFHAKDDEWIQNGLLPLKEFRPGGLILNADANNRYARSLIARSSQSGVQALLKKWASDPDNLDVDAAATMLWQLLVDDLKLLVPVTLRSQHDRILGPDVWQLDADKTKVVKSNEVHRCSTCQRIAARAAPHNKCARHHCSGETKVSPPDQKNYDVWLMGKPFVMVSPEEHTAQVPGEIRNKIEHEFKSRHGKTNCLVATPTLEMGVNIGALDMALMRNVPPRPSNYWQRAGRAGREERMAVVVTYCRRSQHDRYFFEDPLRLLGGAIEAPAFNLQNPLMAAKHIRSAILSELLLESRDASEHSQPVGETLKELFPAFIRNYLLDEDDKFRDRPLSAAPLKALLTDMRVKIADSLGELFAKHWPEEAKELASRAMIELTIDSAADELDAVLARLHRRLTWARTTRGELHKKKDAGLIEKDEEQLLRRCDEYVNGIVRRDSKTYTLTVLSTEGYLPGYGIYEGGITAFARRGFAQNTGPKPFELSRSNVVALREFVPGNRLYANRGTFYANRFHMGAEETSKIRTLRVNVTTGCVTDDFTDTAYAQAGAVAIDALPLTDLDLAHESRITEDENLRFSMPVTVLGRLRKRCRGGKAIKIGNFEVHHLRGQGIELVNLGEAGRVTAGTLGHYICSVCGAAKTPYAVPLEIQRFQQAHLERCGKIPALMALSVQTEVDMLHFHSLQDQASGINIGEALRIAAAQLFDMGLEDLQLLLIQKPDGTTDLIVYDPMPGGSGLLEQILGRWREVVDAARQLLAGCPNGCDSACYACLKTFRNQFFHALLCGSRSNWATSAAAGTTCSAPESRLHHARRSGRC
ncbi:MAG TPA: DEAD/DEAH box helicase [Planctomycetota bacterium]|nr:DEAD/DEAH box helicase [Planctomycetota bacterium]